MKVSARGSIQDKGVLVFQFNQKSCKISIPCVLRI
jgi:hypothetical protein